MTSVSSARAGIEHSSVHVCNRAYFFMSTPKRLNLEPYTNVGIDTNVMCTLIMEWNMCSKIGARFPIFVTSISRLNFQTLIVFAAYNFVIRTMNHEIFVHPCFFIR